MSGYILPRKPVGEGSDVELLLQDSNTIQALSTTVSEYPEHAVPELGTKASCNKVDLFIEGWPTSSSVLKKQSRSWTSLLVDLLIVISTLPFFALAISVYRVGRKRVDAHDWSIYQSTTRIVSTPRTSLLKVL